MRNLLGLVVLLTAAFPSHGQAQSLSSDDPDFVALLHARKAAESYIAEGRYSTAIQVLLQSMRSAPGDRPALADPAYGNGQMISYILLHLMPEPNAYAFAESGFAVDTYEMDRMVRALCFIAIGLNTEDKTSLTREVSEVASSKNRLIRAMTLYFLSLPYFYTDTRFTEQNAALLAKEFPNLELSQTALSLPLYASVETKDFDQVAADMSEVPPKSTVPVRQPWALGLRERVRSSGNNIATMKTTERSRVQAIQPLLVGITDAHTWRERYFSLLLTKSEFGGEAGSAMREATRRLSSSDANTPDVVLARVELMGALGQDCVIEPDNLGTRDEVFSLAQAVLAKGVTETTPERVLWETWIYGLQGTAASLGKAGHIAEALAIYDALAARLPGSKVAMACENAANALANGTHSGLDNK